MTFPFPLYTYLFASVDHLQSRLIWDLYGPNRSPKTKHVAPHWHYALQNQAPQAGGSYLQ